MLRGGNPLTVGVGMIIEVIRKNNSDYDPDVGAGPDSIPSSNDPIYLGTLLRCFAKRVPDFMELLLSPTHAVADGNSQITIKRKELGVAFGNKIEPLGFDRFKTCELMAELLHCSNMGLLNERGSEAFVRQRDEERDRLKAEGSLSARPPTSAVTEFSEDSTNFANGVSPLGLNSGPEEVRKLEIANNVDDDGFEDVGNPADLAEDVKDDFDEKLDEKSPFDIESEPAQMPTLHKPIKPRLDLDEEFVDEPLTSPRLEALDEKESDITEEHPEPLEPLPTPDPAGIPKAEPEPDPASPTSGLASGISHLAVNHDTTMADPDKVQQPDPEAIEPPVTQETQAQNTSADAPPLPHRERSQEYISPEPSSSRGLSPHPEDKPAPLFTSRTSHQSSQTEEETLGPSEAEGNTAQSQDTIDATRGDEGDTNRSVLISGIEQSFTPQFEYDVDGQPMVGDFLKIMFVEHQVVPTILVSSATLIRSSIESSNLIPVAGVLLSIPVEQFSS